MTRHLTIRQNIGLLLLTLFLTVGLAVTAILGADQLQREEQALVADVENLARTGVQPQVAIYYRDAEVLDTLAKQAMRNPLTQYVFILDRLGNVLSLRQRDEQAPSARPAAVDLDPTLLDVTVTSGTSRVGAGPVRDVWVPVFSFVNPYVENLTRDQFGQTLAEARNRGAQNVIGYFLVGVDETALYDKLKAYLIRVALTCLGFALLLTYLGWRVVCRVTAPLANLAQLADDVSAGKLNQTFRAKGAGEARNIAAMLNLVLAELNSHKLKMDVETHLLNLKVHERTEQLSQRNQELQEAVAQVTAARNRMRQLAYYDSLTSLPNRQLFTEQLELALKMARRDKTSVALLFLDLDNFKRINDSLGHKAGDDLLREVGARLASCIRESDLISQYLSEESPIGVSRLGGDEFTVVLTRLESPQAAGLVAERLLEALRAPMLIDGHEIVITPSVGIAIAPDHADNVERLLKCADTAMYHAKKTGKNNYAYYSAAMDGTSVGRLQMEADLRRAIERGEMTLHYQPQVDIETGQICGAEALIRWNHPERGMVSPAHFIPIAEEMGLIVELGAWTLLEACRQCKAFHDQGLNLPKVAVNVSSLQFNTAFVKLVREVLAESHLDPGLLELELTEGVIMSNAKASVHALEELKALGCAISIDDFGTGYSSLSYLSRFPLDELKIDRSFVVDYDKSANNMMLVSAIIAMGKSLNLRMVAEGVDNPDQFRFLRRQGVQIIQGYLFSKPVPPADLAKLLTDAPYYDKIKDMGR